MIPYFWLGDGAEDCPMETYERLPEELAVTFEPDFGLPVPDEVQADE